MGITHAVHFGFSKKVIQPDGPALPVAFAIKRQQLKSAGDYQATVACLTGTQINK